MTQEERDCRDRGTLDLLVHRELDTGRKCNRDTQPSERGRVEREREAEERKSVSEGGKDVTITKQGRSRQSFHNEAWSVEGRP